LQLPDACGKVSRLKALLVDLPASKGEVKLLSTNWLCQTELTYLSTANTTKRVFWQDNKKDGIV
jgi:hypothetical protein